MHVHAADKMGNRRAKVLALLTGNFQRRNSNHKHLMDGETDPQSDAQLKGDAKDQQLDAQLMDGEADPQLGVQLEAMGFASFGQKHKRPKHHHGSSSLESVPTSLPKKPLASISSPTEAGQVPVNNQAKGVGLTKSQVSYSIAVKLFPSTSYLAHELERDFRDNPDHSETTLAPVTAGAHLSPIIQGASSTIRGRLWRGGWGCL